VNALSHRPGNPAPGGDLQPRASLVSVNAGIPRTVEWRGESVSTGIFKSPAEGPVRVGRLNLAGDRQADPSVHGGELKAVYAYPSEHYAWWREPLGDPGWGAFGENLTTAGLAEDTTCVGDRLRIGTAELVVTQPRLPCFKLGIRFGRPDVQKLMLQSGRTGFYLSVAREGEIRAGDEITVAGRASDSVSIAEIVGLYRTDQPDRDLLRRLGGLAVMPESLRKRYRKLLAELDA